MYKVLIADDEYTIREGLATTIAWNELDCEVVGLAKDGIEAIELVRTTKPDIVLTDIKMPGKNGLDLVDEALKINPAVKIILLTGYNEFNYARQALQLGVMEFLLKPAVYEEIMETVSKAAQSIASERRRNEELSGFREEFKKQLDFYREAFLKTLIVSPPIPSAGKEAWLEERLSLYRLKKSAYLYVMLAKIDRFEIIRTSDSEEEWQLQRMAFTYHLKQYFSGRGQGAPLSLRDDLYAFVLRFDEEQDSQTLTSLSQELQEVTHRKYLRLTLSIGISRIKYSYLELSRGFVEAEEALRHVFYLGNEAIIFYEDVYHKEESRLSGGGYMDFFTPILKSLRIGDEPSARQHLAYLFESLEANRESRESVKTVCVDLLSQIMHSMVNSHLAVTPAKRERLYTEIMQCETFEACCEFLNNVICELSTDIYKNTRSDHRKIIGQVMDLLGKHYREEINLNWLSEKVHLNSSYISRLIKNECHETFTELLTKQRMEKAKEMLKDPQLKIYEVADRIGMTDAHYFSMKFKKYTGMSPSEYRDHFEALF